MAYTLHETKSVSEYKNVEISGWTAFVQAQLNGGNVIPYVDTEIGSGVSFSPISSSVFNKYRWKFVLEIPTKAGMKTLESSVFTSTSFTQSMGPFGSGYTTANDNIPQGNQTASYKLYKELINNNPSINLTSPLNNQTLSEGNVFSIQGSAGDTDSGNVVTVKFKINGGTARAIASGVSDGSSPISFSKALTYSNKRLWDGSTDVAGVDLAEGVDHTLTVWAEDDQGGKSAEITRKFRVIWNRPPTISGTDTDLGVISVAPSQTYTVSDPEGQSFTITEYLDGEVLRTFSGVAGQEYTVTVPTDKWLRTSLAQHTLKVRATDSAGQYSERIYTFTRTDDRIVFELDEPFLTDAKANRILVTLDAVIPSGASYIVEACNNAFDAQPTWEDVTGPVSAGRGYIFTNETKTAANWGVSIRFTFLKGTATEKILINGFGGAFD